jgi:hypothetical protein
MVASFGREFPAADLRDLQGAQRCSAQPRLRAARADAGAVIGMEKTDIGRELSEYQPKSPKSIVFEHFENEKVRRRKPATGVECSHRCRAGMPLPFIPPLSVTMILP